MSYTVTITYTAANDIYNMQNQELNVKTVAPIPGLSASTMPGKWPGASKPYIYAADNATAPEYNKENLFTNTNGSITAIANISLLTSAQKRWPQSVAMNLMNILEAYLTPQISIYRAWQTFKMTAELDGATNKFTCDTYAEASFYVQAGAALKDFGFTVTSAEAAASKVDAG
jgi:hypothetical protein